MAGEGRRPIKVDDTIVEISTDKVDLELPSPATGTVSEILIAEGETVTVGAGDRADLANGAGPPRRRSARRAARPPQPASATAASGAGTAPPPPGRRAHRPRGRRRRAAAGDRRPTGPASRRSRPARQPSRASRSTRVQGSRPDGRITKSDVLEAASEQRRRDRRRAPAGQRRRRDRDRTHPDGHQRPDGAERRPREAQLMKGGAAALARYMEQSRAIPTATSFRTLTVSSSTRAAAS